MKIKYEWCHFKYWQHFDAIRNFNKISMVHKNGMSIDLKCLLAYILVTNKEPWFWLIRSKVLSCILSSDILILISMSSISWICRGRGTSKRKKKNGTLVVWSSWVKRLYNIHWYALQAHSCAHVQWKVGGDSKYSKCEETQPYFLCS